VQIVAVVVVVGCIAAAVEGRIVAVFGSFVAVDAAANTVVAEYMAAAAAAAAAVDIAFVVVDDIEFVAAAAAAAAVACVDWRAVLVFEAVKQYDSPSAGCWRRD